MIWITVDDLVESDEGKVAPLIGREIRRFHALRILVGEGRRADKVICHWVRFSIGFVITVVWIYTVDTSIACGTLPQVARVQIGGDVWFVAYVPQNSSKDFFNFCIVVASCLLLEQAAGVKWTFTARRV